MSGTTLIALISRCRALGRPRLQADDAELLRRFAQQREAAAFEELLERYAPLVWGVCRRMLPGEADCEDAFQAVFLALVRNPGSINPNQALGGWLHTVAVRVIRKTQARARRQRSQAVLPERVMARDVADEVGSRELFRLVDQEIERLPVLLRLPLVLCCLQGRTRDEAAEKLGCSVAAVKSRLERGRDLLRRRLERRGVQLPAAFLVLGLTTERIRAALWAKTMQSALYAPAPAIVALAEAGVSAATMSKCKLFLVVLLLASTAAGAAGTMLMEKPAEALALPQAKSEGAEPKKSEAPQVRRDRHGDPLPEGAVARLGTVRWRHGLAINALAYSPDGKMIAIVGAGRAITLWDAATGKEIHPFPNISDQSDSLAFSPNGKILATGGFAFCRLWDVTIGKELRQFDGGKITFSPDGILVAIAGGPGRERTLRLCDAATGKELRQIECGSSGVCGLAYSPDGKRIATADMNGIIRLWDPATGKEQHRLQGHSKGVWKIAFSPDGKQLASSSEDETIRLWDPTTGRQIRILGEKLGVHSSMPIAFSPDGTLLASGHIGGNIRIWDVAAGKEKRRWQAGAGAMALRAVAFSPDGKRLASGAESFRLWDVATGRERHPSEEHNGFVQFVRFSPDGKKLASIGWDRCLLAWDLATAMPKRRFSWTTESLSSPALSPDGNTFALGSGADSEVRLWDLRTDKMVRVLKKQEKGGMHALSFSSDGRLLAAGSFDSFLHIWEARDGKILHQLDTKAAILAFSPRGKLLANSTSFVPADEHVIHLWDVDSGKRIRSLKCSGMVYALSFSADGKVLAASITDRNDFTGSVQMWDVVSGKALCRHMGHQEPVSAIAFSPDGKLAASGSGTVGYKDSSVHVWEAATGRLLRRFEGHHSCVGSVAFSPDGLTVASGAGDSTILLWDITGRRTDGRWHVKPLTPRQLEPCWTALADTDAAKAYDAVWTLVAAPEQAVPFLQKHLLPVPRFEAKAVVRLIADLDSEDFKVRQKAMVELTRLGDAIAPALQAALDGKPSPEVRRRIEQLLDQTREWTAERLRDHRAIQALEHIATQSAQEVLRALAGGAPGASRTEEAKAALQRRAP